VKISNPRDLLLALLADLLFVERRLAGEVLLHVARSVRDEELATLLRAHREETAGHVARLEAAFRRAEASPSANLSRAFEGAVAQHEELAASILEPRLADLFHAAAALRVEHLEQAGYRALLELAPREVAELVAPSLEEEERAAEELVRTLARLRS
jgi:ferritin-like metal-binding protein YciE